MFFLRYGCLCTNSTAFINQQSYDYYCNAQCTGNSNETCGGYQYLSAYDNSPNGKFKIAYFIFFFL